MIASDHSGPGVPPDGVTPSPIGPVLDEPVPVDITWDYSDFEEAPVEAPDWLDAVPGLDRPEVAVTIDEADGDRITVEIESMAHTGRVAIVIEDTGVFAQRTTPGTVEIPAEAYTTDDGVHQVMVFADNELRGPILIESPWPAPDT